MDDKTRTLLKKHIRMLDYIRADLVAILGEPQQPYAPPIDPKTGQLNQSLPVSPLYQNFEAAKVSMPLEPIPVGVYWSDVGNFYDVRTRLGMGADFYTKWIRRRAEFPLNQESFSIAPLIAEGVEVCSLCRFTPDRCICGHFPLHGAAADNPFATLMAEIGAGFRMHDGPPLAYFWADANGDLTMDGEGKRYDYHTVEVTGADRDAVLDDFTTLVRQYLSANLPGNGIRWRVRPELIHNGDGTRWKAFTRLVVVPA